MSSRSRVRVTGPLTSFADGFAAALSRQGYRPNAAADQLQLLAHLSRWLATKGLDATSLTASVLNEFLAARRSQGYTLWLSPKALAPLVGYMRGLGFALPAPKAVLSPAEALLARYRRYLVDARGLADTSARGYVDMVRPFVATRVVDDELDWVGLRPADLNAFVLSTCRSLSIGSAKLAVTALRSLLGYLHLEGLIPRPLGAVIPSVAGWRLAGLPRSLEPAEVGRLLAACDRRTRAGRRDFAMLVLLVRLGLCAGEVRTLSLEDIDWRAGELVVRGKGSRIERLPLPSDVGQAMAAYLRRGRPVTAQGRTLFVRVRAPHRPLSSGGVTSAVMGAASRAGLGRVSAHRLRHTVATQMVRSGVPLPEVGQVLRHRRLLTTAIYAKVDREGLRRLARPWPGGAI
jgi:site-specific recombinase XerD